MCLEFGESVKIRAHSVKTEKMRKLLFILFGGFLYPAVLKSVAYVSGGGGIFFTFDGRMCMCEGRRALGIAPGPEGDKRWNAAQRNNTNF